MGATPSRNQDGDRKFTFTRSLLLPRMQTATLYTSIVTNDSDETTKIYLPDYLFSTGKSYLRNRKAPGNSGNDSRYNRFNLYHNTMLTKKALPT